MLPLGLWRTLCVCVCVSQESLEYLHHLSPEPASFFLTALGPLLQQRRELRDSLMLVLRKAVLQRSLDTRVVAVEGYAAVLHQRTPHSPARSRVCGRQVCV